IDRVRGNELRRACGRGRGRTPGAARRVLQDASTIAGPTDPIELPPEATKVDWEVELGVVIGTRTYRVASAGDALDHVAGYVLANDLSERRLQIEESGGQWSKGKNLPGFTPLGPWIRPAAEVDPGDLRLRS